MTCNQGSLSTIRNPTEPADCGCECDMTDLTYTGESFPCFDIVPGSKLDVFLTRIGAKVCEMDTDITVTDIDFDCIPNTTAPTGGTVSSVLQWFADELIPKSGNDCNCPVTNNIFFTDTYGIVQCDGGQDSGYLKFSGDYALLNADTQARISADLKIDNGFGAGYTETASSIDLSGFNTDQLNYSYGIDCTGASRSITLSQIAAASLDHKNRRFSIRRLDCTVANTCTIQAFAGETIEGAASVTLGVGHGYIIQADDATNDWVIVAEYFGGCDAIEQQNDGDIYMAYNLGIGDSSPDAKIDVVTTDTTQTIAIFENTGAASADLMQIKRNGAVIDVFDATGDLGVGIDIPAARVHAKLPTATGGTDNVILGTTSTGTTIWQSAIDASACFSLIGNTGFAENSLRINGAAAPTFKGVQLQTAGTTVWSIGQKPDNNLTISATSSFTGGIELVSATGAIYLNEKVKKYNAIAPTNGQLLIGDTVGAEFDAATLTEGRAITVTNGAGSITLKNKNTCVTTTIAITLDETNYKVIGDTTAGSFSITLPTAASASGWEYTIIKPVAGNTLTIQANGAELINAANTATMSNAYSVRTIYSNGTQWYIISSI